MVSVVLKSFVNGVKTIRLNRPKRKNAFDATMYQTITEILNEDAKNDDVVVTVITGEGDYYSSGNDLKAALETLDTKTGLKNVSDMVEAFINYPKLIISVVNGPAIGIAATTVALCDIVYASDTALFDTPFVKLALCVEGCASYNFPRILGRSVASEMIFLGKKLTAQEAFRLGLVSKVIPQNEIPKFIDSLQQYGKLPVGIVKKNKSLLMANFIDLFKEINKKELEGVGECANSEEFGSAVMEFLSKKSKL